MSSLNKTWSSILDEEFKKEYFIHLKEFIDTSYQSSTCYPPKELIFNALRLTPFEEVKVVIIGQDPYHGPNQAHGLCFSVNDEIAFPPSLINIFKEINQDIGKPIPTTGNLSHWAKQGVFLLNATLTVEAHQAGSHQGKGWEKFTDEVIRILSKEKEGLIFLLWGGFARKKAQLINKEKHYILETGHPSPLSANRGLWFGNKHFSKTNELLQKLGKTPIAW